MIYVNYLEIDSVSIEDIAIIKKNIPVNFQRRVSGKLISSKKSLLGRALLYDYLIKAKNKPVNKLVFKLYKSKKLYIENEFSFNISHTKSYVALAITNDEKITNIGIDIEKKREISNLNNLLNYFTVREKEAILNNTKKSEEFLKIWTRKEALYKAIGKGIYHANSLKIMCLNKTTKCSNKCWHLESFKLNKSHIASCATNIKSKIVTKEVKNIEIIETLNKRNNIK